MMTCIGPIMEWLPPSEDDIYHENHPLHHIVVIENEEMIEANEEMERGE